MWIENKRDAVALYFEKRGKRDKIYWNRLVLYVLKQKTRKR